MAVQQADAAARLRRPLIADALERLDMRVDLSEWQRAVEDFAKTGSTADPIRELAVLFNKLYPHGPQVSGEGDQFVVTHVGDPDAVLANPYEAGRAALAARHAALAARHAASQRLAEGFRIYAAATVVYADTREDAIPEARVWTPDVERELVDYFKANPEQMRSMAPRKFEELVAAVLKNQGFNVELTPYCKDGGVDIIAVDKGGRAAERRVLVECKRYAAENKVGLAIVQRLLGVVFDIRHLASYGMVVTTSTFTGPAIDCAQANSHILSLRDYFAIVEWLKGCHFV